MSWTPGGTTGGSRNGDHEEAWLPALEVFGRAAHRPTGSNMECSGSSPGMERKATNDCVLLAMW
jgi:hypothetical protein